MKLQSRSGLSVATSRCNACGEPTAGAEAAFRVRRGREIDVIVECPNCSLAFLDPMPSTEVLSRFYGEDYHAFQRPRRDQARIDAMIASLRVGNRCNHIPVIPGGRYLDIGCATGDMVMILGQLGMQAEGVEPSPFASAKAREAGLKVFTGTLDRARFPDDSFDCMSMFHVLEHVRDPLGQLSECLRILRPGGELVVGVPNFRSLVFEKIQCSWGGLDTPRHLYHFTTSTLQRIARQAGFDVTAMETESRAEHVEVELINHFRKRYHVPGRIFRWTKALKAVSRGLARKGEALGRGEAIIAYLRKPVNGSERLSPYDTDQHHGAMARAEEPQGVA